MVQHERTSSASFRLAIMMFLQYAVWGAWLIVLPNYLGSPPQKGGLGFTDAQVAWTLGLAASIGAVAAPFIAGQVADRYLNGERALALLLLAGGIVKIVTAHTTAFAPFLLLSVVYSVLYMPTLALTNSIAMKNLDDPERQFPTVRALGTLGWIVASSLFPLMWLNATTPAGEPDVVENTRRVADALSFSGVISIAYGLYCVAVLPKTPPRRSAEEPLAFAKAFGMLRHPGFLVAVIVGLPISMIHTAYFIRVNPFLTDAVHVPLKWTGLILSLGQWSELVFLALLSLFVKRIGYKGVLALGCLGYIARFSIFASTDNVPLIAVAQALHGVCYGCFFAGAYLYVDRIAPVDIRHSAQTVFAIIMLGLGPVAATFFSPLFQDYVKGGSYSEFWWAQAAVAAASLVILLLAFKPHLPGEGAADAATGLNHE